MNLFLGQKSELDSVDRGRHGLRYIHDSITVGRFAVVEVEELDRVGNGRWSQSATSDFSGTLWKRAHLKSERRWGSLLQGKLS